jgi:hypothetical protein
VIRFRPNVPVFEGLVDTGAPITVFPQKVWSSCADDIEWLTKESDERVPEWLRSVGGLTGGTIPCRIGRVPLSIYGKQMRCIFQNVAVIGKMVLDQGRLRPKVLLGLYGPPLNCGFHWSRREYPQAWLDWPAAAATQ